MDERERILVHRLKTNWLTQRRCYEPPVPGTQIGVATYPVACFSTVNPSPVNPVVTTPYPPASIPSGSNTIVTTTPAAAPWGFPTWPQYQYLGCYQTGSLGIAFSNTSNLNGVEACLSYCYTAGGNGTIFVAVTMDYGGPSQSL